MFRYGDSEELNRVVILTLLARAVHIGGLEQVSDKCGDDDSDNGSVGDVAIGLHYLLFTSL